MPSFFNTIIIGGGPAGLFTAAHVLSESVLLLEKKPLPGRKLLIAGSGRCNLTHSGPVSDFLPHYGDHARFLRPSLFAFSNQALIRFFNERNLPTYIDKNGKVFPASDRSADVLEVLLNECKKRKVVLAANSEVLAIERQGNGFLIHTLEADFECCYLVVATGGLSYPSTGSTGAGYRFALSLGHTLVSPKPSLSPVIVKDYPFAEHAGISLPAITLSLFRNGKKIREHTGDLGFTHKGLSGPAILDASRYFEAGDTLKVNFTSQKADVFQQDLIQASAGKGRMAMGTYLKSYEIPRNLLKTLLMLAGIDSELPLAELRKEQRKLLTEHLCEHSFCIERVAGFKQAMVTAGGVSLLEINSATMESKRTENLYFAGEVMDIDGDTGGYNLQAAFSTAYSVAQSINGKIMHQGHDS